MNRDEGPTIWSGKCEQRQGGPPSNSWKWSSFAITEFLKSLNIERFLCFVTGLWHIGWWEGNTAFRRAEAACRYSEGASQESSGPSIGRSHLCSWFREWKGEGACQQELVLTAWIYTVGVACQVVLFKKYNTKIQSGQYVMHFNEMGTSRTDLFWDQVGIEVKNV